MVVGTPGFMAPEQARGEPVTPATDVFSLGATLLFAATGEGPYGQGDPGAPDGPGGQRQGRQGPEVAARVLRKLLRSMLAPRPDRRPTAAALAGTGPDGPMVRALAERVRRPAAAPPSSAVPWRRSPS